MTNIKARASISSIAHDSVFSAMKTIILTLRYGDVSQAGERYRLHVSQPVAKETTIWRSITNRNKRLAETERIVYFHWSITIHWIIKYVFNRFLFLLFLLASWFLLFNHLQLHFYIFWKFIYSCNFYISP